MQPTNNVDQDKTTIFHVTSLDATVTSMKTDFNPTRPTLTIVKGPSSGQTFELSEESVTLGRDPSNSVFLNDATVSRKHARIDLSGLAAGHATVEDLGSLNGTWVNGAIVSKASLRDGSTLQIGTFRMVFHTNRRSKRIETGA